MLATEKIGLRRRPSADRPDFFCFRVVDPVVCDVETRVTIDSYVTSQLHVVRGGVVLCVIGVNVCVANVNRHIIASCCQPVFVGCLARGSDFNRHILWSFYFSTDQTGTRKNNSEQQNQRSHRERRRYCSKSSMKSQNRYRGTKYAGPTITARL